MIPCLSFIKTPVIIFLTLLSIAAFSSNALCSEKNKTRILIFSAGSTINAVTDIGNLFNNKGKGKCLISFASSSTLARQIANGAPAHIFISANPKWMDYLTEKVLIDKNSRFDLLSNRIVLIAPVGSNIKIKIESGLDHGLNLAKILGCNRLAMGDPDHVPAGIYGKQALVSLGLWKDVERKTAPMKDVRSALALVERQECPLGIVYSTDALISKKVKIIYTFPENSHPPITYPVALVTANKSVLANSFLDLLTSEQAKRIFEKYGFVVKQRVSGK